MAAAGPPADLHAALALPLPIAVICELLGVPYEDPAAMGMFLLFAGHETTVSAIGKGAMWLLANPEQWQALVADPSRIATAVEELSFDTDVLTAGLTALPVTW
ncbi:hypothetical protein [Nonomuraea basaltis]|uniref:hypothetical protein n=1 Tax=Nonomuraea basaltis TaxID=2495887 RepID=UPI001F0EB8B1|nr:hypothetical protein [Nonomuraea basaltis]